MDGYRLAFAIRDHAGRLQANETVGLFPDLNAAAEALRAAQAAAAWSLREEQPSPPAVF